MENGIEPIKCIEFLGIAFVKYSSGAVFFGQRTKKNVYYGIWVYKIGCDM